MQINLLSQRYYIWRQQVYTSFVPRQYIDANPFVITNTFVFGPNKFLTGKYLGVLPSNLETICNEWGNISNMTHLHVFLDIHHQQHVPLRRTINPLVMIIFMAETEVMGITLGAVISILFYRYYVSRQN